MKSSVNQISQNMDWTLPRLISIFFAAAFVAETSQGRFVAVGAFGETMITVVFSPLGHEAISVISMRPSSRKERTFHET